MAGKKTAKRKSAPQKFPWEKLTWDDLAEWTDSRSLERGRSYQRRGAVQNLAILPHGELIADVYGTHRYATHIELAGRSRDLNQRLESACSCPVGHRCKHAVAVILQYLHTIENGTPVPQADADDSRLTLIEQGWIEEEDDGDDFDVDDGEFDDTVFQSNPKRKSARNAKSQHSISDAEIAKHLAAKQKDELVAIIMQLCQSDQQTMQSFVDRMTLETGDYASIVREARKELRSVTSEDVWYDPWNDNGNLADYARLQSQLQTLIDAEQFDAVVELGRELLERGMEQVAAAHDEGETAVELATTLTIVAKAVVPSSLSDSAKILFAIDALSHDEYDLCYEFSNVLEHTFSKEGWANVADTLKTRLPDKAFSKRDRSQGDFLKSYARERLSNWIIRALEEAGDDQAATQFCIDEATNGGTYQRAVNRLIELKRYDEARNLATEGLANTDPSYSGLIKKLQDSLAQIAAKNKDHSLAAALAADRFIAQPGVSSLQDLLKAARKAKCEPAAKQVAMRFLETGIEPQFAPTDSAKKSRSQKTKRPAGNEPPQWPFAAPPRATSDRPQFNRAHTRKPGPHFVVLIRCAIENRDPETALRWYDTMSASQTNQHFPWNRLDVEVADAVSTAYPDRAVDIYCTAADRLAAETNTKLYPQAVSLLRKAHKVLNSQKRPHEFEIVLDTFQQRHHRKRRLIELLQGLGGQPIISKKSVKRK